jgi:hypothetical protein
VGTSLQRGDGVSDEGYYEARENILLKQELAKQAERIRELERNLECVLASLLVVNCDYCKHWCPATGPGYKPTCNRGVAERFDDNGESGYITANFYCKHWEKK